MSETITCKGRKKNLEHCKKILKYDRKKKYCVNHEDQENSIRLIYDEIDYKKYPFHLFEIIHKENITGLVTAKVEFQDNTIFKSFEGYFYDEMITSIGKMTYKNNNVVICRGNLQFDIVKNRIKTTGIENLTITFENNNDMFFCKQHNSVVFFHNNFLETKSNMIEGTFTKNNTKYIGSFYLNTSGLIIPYIFDNSIKRIVDKYVYESIVDNLKVYETKIHVELANGDKFFFNIYLGHRVYCNYTYANKNVYYGEVEYKIQNENEIIIQFHGKGVLKDNNGIVLQEGTWKNNVFQILHVAGNENDACKICFHYIGDILLLPCSHLGYCKQCCDKISECPICRAKIINRIKTYKN